MNAEPLLAANRVTKRFGAVVALSDVSFAALAGEVHCLLGDNGSGKSTLIKLLSGVHQPSGGELLVDGKPTILDSPRDALDRGIATVFQDLAMIPLMSVARNFFLGREPLRRWGPVAVLDERLAAAVTREEMAKMGIALRDPDQPVGTLSGGQRQCVAIARAVYFGARVLILDEPTSALGVTQTQMVLDCVSAVRSRGLGVIFITHNVRHAMALGDRFTVLRQGQTLESRSRGTIGADELQALMSGSLEPKIGQAAVQ